MVNLADWIRRLRRRSFTVWVMEDLKVVYIANPKAASSSIRDMIRGREQKRLFPDPVRGCPQSLNSHTEKRFRISTSQAGAWRLRKRYFIFSFVRNPLTRLYSCYRDKVVKAVFTHKQCPLRPYGIHFGMTFEQFVKRVVDIPDKRADQHFRSQYTLLTHEGQLIPHYLGMLETFDEDWQRLTRQFDLPNPGRTRRISAPLPDPTLPLSPTTAQDAIERYREDIELFGYHDCVSRLLVQIQEAATTREPS